MARRNLDRFSGRRRLLVASRGDGLSLVAAGLALLVPIAAERPALAHSLSYGGRLVSNEGASRQGQADIEINFYDAAENGNKLGSSPYQFAATPLSQGVFSIELELSDSDFAAIFKDPNAPAWIEVTDKGERRVYPRQRFGVVPYALKVPVDGSTLGFDERGLLKVLVTPSANGGGTVTSITAGAGLTGGTIVESGTIALASPMPALDGGALTNVNAVKLQGRGMSPTAPADGQVLKWNAGSSTWEAAADDGGVAGALSGGQNLGAGDATTADVFASTAAPNLRFRRLKAGAGVELTQNANDVTVAVAAGGISAVQLAADSVGSAQVAASAVGTAELGDDAVTAAKIAAGAVSTSEVLDGTLANSDISDVAAIATSKISGAIIAVSGHGLGGLATLSAVGGSEITDGQIANADVSGSAGIATSKLSGPVTSIAGHGLGDLATASAVGSAQITDGAIADADVSGTAAISSTKISFVANSISGNAVDGGTISNFGSTGIDDDAASLAMTISSSGNVGIGTTVPQGKLQVIGQVVSTLSSIASLTVDFNAGNFQTDSVAAGTLMLSNMVDGTTYTLILTNATGGPYLLSGSGVSAWKCAPACVADTVTVTAGKHTLLSITKAGSTAYVFWVKDL